MNKYPKGKSIYWIFYHKQELLFNIFLFFVMSVVGIVYGFSMMPKSPVGIIFFVIAVYGIYFLATNIIKLYKEFKR